MNKHPLIGDVIFFNKNKERLIIMDKKRFIKIGAVVIGFFIFGILLFLIVNSYSMNRMVENEIEELISEAKNIEVTTYSVKDIEGLPDPVGCANLKLIRERGLC
jgi:hypothetical protein